MKKEDLRPIMYMSSPKADSYTIHGFFHQWSYKSLKVDQIETTEPLAIIETSKGEALCVPAESIKFMDREY